MKKDLKKILEDFDNCKSLHEDFTEKCVSLIVDLLKNESIKVHQITNRVKDRVKLEGKVLKKNFKYSSLNEITDISGIRIIAYFEDEVERIATIFNNEFEIDIENSIDKRQLENDKFGYRSLHYIVSLSKERLKLSEYKRFKNLKFELQIRTILQHSWAEIEHDIGYKGDITIPQFAKRTFYRVAALLETADLEFVKLKDLLKDYETGVASEILETPETVKIDQASLVSFINSSAKIAELDKKFAEYNDVPLKGNFEIFMDEMLQTLKDLNIETIKQLDEVIHEKEDEIFKAYKKNSDASEGKITAIYKGIGIFQLRYLDK